MHAVPRIQTRPNDFHKGFFHISLAQPEHSLHQINSSPSLSTLLTKSWPPKCRFLHVLHFFDKYFGPVHFPFILMYCLFHTSCNDTCWQKHTTPFDASFPHFSHPQKTFFFWLRLELFTIFLLFYQTVKARCVLQGRIHLFSLLLDCFPCHFRHKTLVQHSTCLCQLIRLFIAFVDKLLKLRHVLLILLCAVRLDIFPRFLFRLEGAILPTFFFHKSASPPFGSMDFLSPLHCPSKFLCCPHAPQAEQGRQLRLLDGALDFKCRLHRAVHPTRRPQLLKIQMHHRSKHMLSTFQRYPEVIDPWQRGP